MCAPADHPDTRATPVPAAEPDSSIDEIHRIGNRVVVSSPFQFAAGAAKPLPPRAASGSTSFSCL